MINRLNIKIKLLSIFLLIGVLSITITGGLFYLNSKKTLKKVYFDKLTAIRETKKSQIEAYFSQIRNQIITFSEDQMVINAMKQFKTTFHNVNINNDFTDSQISQYSQSIKDYYDDEYLARLNPNVKEKIGIEQFLPEGDEAIILQYHYIANNPNPIGSKDILEMSADASQYSITHSKYHPIFRNYQRKFGYYDIFLVDAETGRIVYTVFKEVDLATNLLTGPYKDTNLASAFREARDAADKEFVKLVDFEFYDPSYSYPASFIASPIFDGNKKIGVLLFQVSINEINRVMTGNYNWENEGLGKSGETYIIGSDYRMRNDSRFIIEEPDRYIESLEQIGTDKKVINLINSYSTSIMFQEIRTEAVEDALNRNEGTRIIDDYRSIPVLCSYTPLSIEDVKWVILSEVDKEEVFASLQVIKDRLFLIIVFISTLIVIIAFSISENIAGPILLLMKSADTIAGGDLSKRVNFAREDEIGHLASSFNEMTSKLEKSKKQLQESEEHKRQLLDSLKDGIYQCEPHIEGVFTWVNQACAEIFGYKSTEEMIGTKVRDIYVDPNDRMTLIEKLERDGICLNFACNCKKKNGDFLYTERTTNIIKDEKGKSICIEGIIRDITERRRAEEQIYMLSQAIEQSSCGILVTDEKGIIEYVNPKFSQITGYTFEEAIGENPRILKSGKQSPEIYKEMWETITSGNEWRGEFYNRKKNGKFYWEYISISPITNDKGVVTNFIGIKENITRLKRIEDELRISHQMSSIGRLSASVFHEILNPVNIISGHTQLLLMQAEKGSNTEKDLQSIQCEINRIVNITDNLLKFSQKEDVKTEEVEVNDLLENVLTLIKPELDLKRIKHITKFEKNLPDVLAHGSELREAFLKLITNSIEAMPDGGTLTVKTQVKRNFVEISFEDTGCGIAKKNIDRIFEPFFSTKKEIKGVGLGLSSSYAIIEGYGGRISVESEEGKGTMFVIDLPVKYL